MPAYLQNIYLMEITRIQAREILNQIKVSSFPWQDKDKQKEIYDHYEDIGSIEETIISDVNELGAFLTGAR